MNEYKDVIIVGAGAAGLMCAIEAGKRGRSVLLLEKAEKIGKKIGISGGGRCNFTNLYCTFKNFLSENIHFSKSALAQFTPKDFIHLIEKHKITYHEKKLGQLFCDSSAQAIIQMLQKECAEAQVQVFCNFTIEKIHRSNPFTINSADQTFKCKSLVMASGGCSIPQMGATDFSHQIARQFGLKIVQPRPALVPLLWNEKDLSIFKDLAGISVGSEVSIGKQKFTEQLLFTHKGLSGPAILQISSYWKEFHSIQIQLLHDKNILAVLKNARIKNRDALNILSKYFPKRFAQKWIELYLPKPLSQCSDKELNALISCLNNWKIEPNGTEGYQKAEVTAGGISTEELSSQTMECKNIPGLFFIGEAVDVTGHLGGHNFQWAWSSGYAAGQIV